MDSKHISRVLLVALLQNLWMPTLIHAEIRSSKRGIGAKVLYAAQVEQLAPGVSWAYNWGPTPALLELGGAIEFYPMIWRGEQSRLDEVKAYLEGGASAGVVLYSNEPNFKFPLGSSQDPEAVADWAKAIKSALSGHSIELIGPNMALGTAVEDSVTSYNACKDETIPYTTMDLYLDAFDCYSGEPPDGIGVHPYGGAGELKWAVEQAYARYGKPVWVTEFAFRGVSDEVLYDYTIEALDFLERSPMVAGYAWFIAEGSGQSGLQNVALVTSRGGFELTELGKLYVNFPAYDPDYYYPVPGRVQAEAYHEKENLTLEPSYNRAGFAALLSGRQPGWVSFRLNVAEAGKYRLRLRISSQLLSDIEPDPGVTDPPAGKERDLYFNTELPAGNQIMKVLLNGLNGQVDWLEFERQD